MQSAADAAYFVKICGRSLSDAEQAQVRDGVLTADRWQYIVSGVQEPRFAATLQSLVSVDPMQRILTAPTPILRHVSLQA